MERPGIFEELAELHKQYPEHNQRSSVIHPNQYTQFLTQQVAREIGVTLQQLSDEQRYDDMINLVTNIRGLIQRGSGTLFRSPLSAVHYRFDDEYIPVYPDMYLTHPVFISNRSADPHTPNFFKSLKYEIMTADKIDFMVSFIRWSGLQLLMRPLDERIKRGKLVRILTTNYMYVTEPKALRQLVNMENVELRLFNTEKESFHTKAYLFNRASGLHTVIIGSSNLSHSALNTGHEWNVKLPSAPHMPIYNSARRNFQSIWESPQSIIVDDAYLRQYEEMYLQQREQSGTGRDVVRIPSSGSTLVADARSEYIPENGRIKPNEMQTKALMALHDTRNNGFSKGVVVAATGTGKTYLSALDVQQHGAKTVLFLAHRDELLEGAKQTFVHVFGKSDQCGKLSSADKEWDKPFLFSTVQTMHREEVLTKFQPHRFEYIIVDEFHHAQAATYRKIIDYFQPKFLIGLTATPERMDGRDVLELCENNIVYEIRLRDALSHHLVAPFHYFGLSDQTVNYDDISIQSGAFNEAALVKALATHERVDYVIEMMEKYGFDGDRRVALGFCANIDHAQFMAKEFTLRGYTAAVLTGKDSPEVRQPTMHRLEAADDPLEFIFTVDVFNEGVDIPSTNLLLFLRPTESATIFLQQLGRGLRKTEDKTYVTVLDFIGNYQKSFVVPLALSGQLNHKAFDRDSLRIAVETEFADLPDGCFVDLEPVAREQILQKIESVRMNQTDMLKDLYKSFKQLLGRSPELEDFLYTEDAPSVRYFISKFGSWVQTKRRMNDTNDFDEKLLESTSELQLTQTLESMLPLKWPYEFAILQVAASSGKATVQSVIARLRRFFGASFDDKLQSSFIERSFRRLSSIQDKRKWAFGSVQNDVFVVNEQVRDLWHQEWLTTYLNKRLEYGLVDFRRTFHPTQFFGNQKGLVLYQNYTRNDLIYLFQADAAEGSWREGVSRVDNHYLLFINLNKDESVADHLQYRDHFIDNRHFHWQSQNATSHQSDRGQDYIRHKARDIHIHLFIRKFEKMHGVTLPFTYLGEVDYVSSHGDKPMNITWELETLVPDELYMDFVR